jgi:hypothetical protein
MDRQQFPGLFLIFITMSAIAVFVQVDRMKNKSADLRAKAYRQTEKGVRIEAEEMALFGVSTDPTGTSIQFLTSPPAPTPTLTCPPQELTAGGTATIDVDLNISANYRMWVQMMGKGDSANSVWLQLDNLYCVKVGDLTGMPSDTWEWVDYQSGYPGSKIPAPIIGTGHHIVRLIGNGSEPGVAVDRILMMRDTSCVPEGTGDACIGVVSTPTPTPTPAHPPTPTPTPAVTTSKKNPVEIPIITTTALPKAKQNVPYSAEVAATDKTIDDTLGLTAANLPAGLALTTCSQTDGLGGTTLTCLIAGTPMGKGINFPAFTVTDTVGNNTTKRMKLQVE